MTRDREDCPHCGAPCDREEVDVGVGVIRGPWGCGDCGWSEWPEYDSRSGVRRDGDDRVLDQYGVSHHVERLGGVAVLAGLNVRDRGGMKGAEGADLDLRCVQNAGPRTIAQLLAAPRAAIRSATQLVFAGVPGKDVYNPTAPFDVAGSTVIAARVESPDRESDSQVVFFERGPRAWTPLPGAPRFDLQDPAVATIAGTLVLAGVEVWGEEGALAYKTVFYRGTSLAALERFAEGPIGMKDVRLAALGDGRVLVLTRPQGVRGGRGKIGCVVLDSIDALGADVIDDAPIISGQFADEEWGGANQIVQIGPDELGVLGHVARFDACGDRHYYPIVFEIDLAARRVSPLRLLFERADLPGGTDGPAKRPDLRDVLFSGGVVRHPDGTATIYVGAGDKVVYAVEVVDPYEASRCSRA